MRKRFGLETKLFVVLSGHVGSPDLRLIEGGGDFHLR